MLITAGHLEELISDTRWELDFVSVHCLPPSLQNYKAELNSDPCHIDDHRLRVPTSDYCLTTVILTFMDVAMTNGNVRDMPAYLAECIPCTGTISCDYMQECRSMGIISQPTSVGHISVLYEAADTRNKYVFGSHRPQDIKHNPRRQRR